MVEAKGTSKQTGDVDVDEELQKMQGYYGDGNTAGRFVVLEEEDGLIMYRGEGTKTDP